MSDWHRRHPDLAGTDADPWMANPQHAAASRYVAMYERFPNLDAMIAEHEAKCSHVCSDEACGLIQGAGTLYCTDCNAPLPGREP